MSKDSHAARLAAWRRTWDRLLCDPESTDQKPPASVGESTVGDNAMSTQRPE